MRDTVCPEYRSDVERETVRVDKEGLPLSLFHWLGPRQSRDLDITIAIVLFGLTIGIQATETGLTPAGLPWAVVRYVAVGAPCIALPARRRFPLATLTTTTLGAAFGLALNAHSATLIMVALATYSVASVAPRRTSMSALACTVVALIAGAVIRDGGDLISNLLAGPALVGLGWVSGENTRARRDHEVEQAEQAAERERQRELQLLQTVVDERLRIARELHDVVAHAMSVIAVRSGAARIVMDTEPEETRQALGIIESTSRRSLQEMRLIVDVLRNGEEADGSGLAPTPGLGDLMPLLEQIEEAGVPVDLHVEGDKRPLPPGVDLSAYRIVQEALTNVVRHAGPTQADLRMTYTLNQLTIEVVDGGSADGSQRLAEGEVIPGHGLVGMRERVNLFGGQMDAGRSGRGFRVWVRVPVDERSS